MRIRKEPGLIRFFHGEDGEVAYIVTKPRGLQAEIEFPSDWHEHARAWVRLGFGLVTVALSFRWSRVVPDEYQCSGPRYGFLFFGNLLHLHWGKSRGRQDDPSKIVQMPWGWRHRKHEILSEPETHPYRYVLRRGEVQERTATINVERRTRTRPWVPRKLVSTYINVKFSDEVGERSGSWKGGCVGCGYDMKPGETPLETLRRMERERKF